MYNNKKPIIIGVLCALVVVMVVGYALLSQSLRINGTSSIDSNWNIRITSISANPSGSAEDKEASGECTTRTSGGCSSTTASFNAGLTSPGDSITYTVTVTNSGTLDGVVSGITLSPQTSSSDVIQVTKSGLSEGDTITKNGGTNTINITVTYNPNIEEQPSNVNSEITLTINYQQDLGQVSPSVPTAQTYSIGDTITYKDTTWKVIKNSLSSENYVTLMKTTVLTNAELGTYAYNGTYDTMEYTWTSTCHNANHGYSEGQYDCDNTNSYTSSKIKEAVEAYATANNMMSDLAEVDNYKIRLIRYDELVDNLGYDPNHNSAGPGTALLATENVPQWIYTNFGENQNNVYGYWTMSPKADQSSSVWNVDSDGGVYEYDVNHSGGGVRPVINLLKANIPAQS